MALRSVSSSTLKLVRKLASHKPTTVSLKDLYEFTLTASVINGGLEVSVDLGEPAGNVCMRFADNMVTLCGKDSGKSSTRHTAAGEQATLIATDAIYSAALAQHSARMQPGDFAVVWHPKVEGFSL